MTNRRIHNSDVLLSFGVYCQVAENVQPQNSLAPRTRAAISLGSSGNLSGDQVFLALDTGHTIIRHQWVARPMPTAVIERVNVLGRREPAILTFADQHGCDIDDTDPQDANPGGNLDDDSVTIHSAVEIPGVNEMEKPAGIAGVDTDIIVEPTGVDMDIDVPVEDTTIAINGGLKQEDLTLDATMAPNVEPAITQKTRSPAEEEQH